MAVVVAVVVTEQVAKVAVMATRPCSMRGSMQRGQVVEQEDNVHS